MKLFLNILIIVLSFNSLFAGITITKPNKNYKPLPNESIQIEWISEYSNSIDLFYRTDLDSNWKLIISDYNSNSYIFQCPDVFFQNIEFKIIQKIDLSPELILNRECLNRNWITYGAFSPDGKNLTICSRDGYIDTYNTDNSFSNKYSSSSSENVFYRFAYKDELIIHSEYDKSKDSSTIVTTNFSSGQISQFLNFNYIDEQGSDLDIDYNPISKKTAIALMKTNKLLLINNTNKNYKLYKTIDSALIYSLCFSPEGDKLVFGDDFGYVSIIDTSLNIVHKFLAHGNENKNKSIWGVAYSPDGSMIATCGVDNFVRVWDSKTYDKIAEFSHTFHARDVSFSPDSKFLLSASLDKTIKEWNIKSNQESFALDYLEQALSANYSFTGDTIIGTGRDNRFMLWRKVPPLVLKDSINLESDTLAWVKYLDMTIEPGETYEIPLYIVVNPKYSGSEKNISFDITTEWPNKLINIYEYNYPKFGLYDKKQYSYDSQLISVIVDTKLALALISNIKEDSIKIIMSKVKSPIGAKVAFNGALLKINDDCKDYNGRLVTFLKSENIERFTNELETVFLFKNLKINQYNISFYNLAGKEIIIENNIKLIDGNKLIFKHNNLENGIYFVVLQINDSYFIEKILIVK